MQKATFTVEEVGEILGIARSSAFNLVKQDDFPSFRIGKRIIIPRDSFFRWMDEKAQAKAM